MAWLPSPVAADLVGGEDTPPAGEGWHRESDIKRMAEAHVPAGYALRAIEIRREASRKYGGAKTTRKSNNFTDQRLGAEATVMASLRTYKREKIIESKDGWIRLTRLPKKTVDKMWAHHIIRALAIGTKFEDQLRTRLDLCNREERAELVAIVKPLTQGQADRKGSPETIVKPLTRKSSRGFRPITPSERAQMVDLYNSGWTQQQIAEKFETRQAVVSQALRHYRSEGGFVRTSPNTRKQGKR